MSKQRAVILAVVVEGLSQAEAARRLNLSRGDVGYKLRKYGLGADSPTT